MEINFTKIDQQFDQYKLSQLPCKKIAQTLNTEYIQPLPPLSVDNVYGRIQWKDRVHYNGLFRDLYSDQDVYYISSDGNIIHATVDENEKIKTTVVYSCPELKQPDEKTENPILLLAREDLAILLCGNQRLHVFDRRNLAQWSLTVSVCLFASSSNSAVRIHAARTDESSRDILHCAISTLDQDKNTYNLHLVSIGLTTKDIISKLKLLTCKQSVSSASFTKQNQMVIVVEGEYQMAPPLLEKIRICEATAKPKADTQREKDATERFQDLVNVEEVDFDTNTPHAGIGYSASGDSSISKATESLEDRFVASSVPFSSFLSDDSKSDNDIRAKILETLERDERPTPDSLLGGYEECDDIDPNAKNAVICLSFTREGEVSGKQLRVNCRKFRYLGASGLGLGLPKLLFQYDVHGLLFEIGVTDHQDISLIHHSTLPAFGFVQASKQQKKYLEFSGTGEVAAIAEFGRRMFLYRCQNPEAETASHTRDQFVVEFDDEDLFGLQFVAANSIFVLTRGNLYYVKLP